MALSQMDVSWLSALAGKLGKTPNELLMLARDNPQVFAAMMAHEGIPPPSDLGPDVGATLAQSGPLPETATSQGPLVPAPIAPSAPAVVGPGASNTGDPAVSASLPVTAPSKEGAGGGQPRLGQDLPYSIEPAKSGATEAPAAEAAATSDFSSGAAQMPDTVGGVLSGIKPPPSPGYLPPLGLPYHPAIQASNPVGEMLAKLGAQPTGSLRSAIG